jgi:hypothetical protein
MYDLLHVRGAVNLSFPDIAIASAQTIPDKDTRISSTATTTSPTSDCVYDKLPSAALNLSTFIAPQPRLSQRLRAGATADGRTTRIQLSRRTASWRSTRSRRVCAQRTEQAVRPLAVAEKDCRRRAPGSAACRRVIARTCDRSAFRDHTRIAVAPNGHQELAMPRCAPVVNVVTRTAARSTEARICRLNARFAACAEGVLRGICRTAAAKWCAAAATGSEAFNTLHRPSVSGNRTAENHCVRSRSTRQEGPHVCDDPRQPARYCCCIVGGGPGHDARLSAAGRRRSRGAEKHGDFAISR